MAIWNLGYSVIHRR